jgi:acetyl esterase/lipase
MKKFATPRRGLVLVGCLAAALLFSRAPAALDASAARTQDVIYGRKHGVALTLDVFRPAKPSGIGVLWMASGGWVSNPGTINPSLVKEHLDRGQTVFAIVHGSRPKYTIPEIHQDIHRAVRYVRTHAGDYGVDPERLGISGISSGGHLSLMQGARGAAGMEGSSDPVERASSRVQAVACFVPPTDFLNWGQPDRAFLELPMLQQFFSAFGPATASADDLKSIARDMSPMVHVTRDMPPTLIIHGEKDELVPLQQAEALGRRLEELGVTHKVVVREGKGHTWPEMAQDVALLAEWYNEHLPKR